MPYALSTPAELCDIERLLLQYDKALKEIAESYGEDSLQYRIELKGRADSIVRLLRKDGCKRCTVRIAEGR